MSEENTGYGIVAQEARSLEVRAELDQAVVTAKQYPRDVAKEYKALVDLIETCPDLAEKAYYSLPPRKNKKTGKLSDPITGASIGTAELVVSYFGNIRVGARVLDVDQGKGMVTVEGMAWDLEKNVKTQEEVTRRVLFPGPDGVQLAIAAAKSIAIRNTVKRITGPFMDRLAEHAMAVAARTVDLEEAKRRALKYWAGYGVKTEEVLAALDVESVDDITQEHIALLRGYANSVKDGASVDEIFRGKSAEAESASIDPAGIKAKPDEEVPDRPAKNQAPANDPEPKKKQHQALMDAIIATCERQGISSGDLTAIVEDLLPENWEGASYLEELTVPLLKLTLEKVTAWAPKR